MIDHVGFKVRDYPRSKAFHTQVLASLGDALVMEVTPEMTGTQARHAGFGRENKPDFWIGTGDATSGGLHLALAADTRAAVDAFHAAALAVVGTDNGMPGLRPTYHPDYYGAFVLDPDGRNIEAVCHVPEKDI